jgi:uridylate kinase
MGEVQVIALGGSLLRPDSEHDRHDWIEKIMMLLKHGISSGMKFILVVGGGAPAREHISIAKQFVTSPDRLDTIGIAATRLNATMLQQIFAANSFDVSAEIPTTSDQVNDMISNHSMVLMGGTVPGQTTDTVAVNVACKTGAEHCIIATNVSHVYSKDPRVHQDASPITSLSLHELLELTGERLEPGASAVVDPVAIKKAIEGRLKILVLDGRQPDLIGAATKNEHFDGTTILP